MNMLRRWQSCRLWLHLAPNVQVHRSMAAKAAPVETGSPVSHSGQPITFRWDVTDCAGTLNDLQRYENELTGLLDADDSAWANAEVKAGKLGFRLATGVKNPTPVSRFVFDVDTKQPAKTLFAHMMSLEGFELIDPFHSDSLAETRARPSERFQYKGRDGYSCAPVNTFDTMGGLQMVCPNGVWYDDELFVNWPVVIPKENRSEESQGVEKEYTMTYALRVRDVGPQRVRLEQIMCISFSPVSARGEWGHKYQAEGLYDRVLKHVGSTELHSG